MILSDKEYNNIYSKVPRVCVDLVIKSKDGVLMIKRDIQPYKNKWHLPGGRVLFRETIIDAIQRIAKKEIGCHVTIKKQVGFMEFLKEVQGGNKRHSISIVFLVTASKMKNGAYLKSGNIHPIHYKFLKENNIL